MTSGLQNCQKQIPPTMKISKEQPLHSCDWQHMATSRHYPVCVPEQYLKLWSTRKHAHFVDPINLAKTGFPGQFSLDVFWPMDFDVGPNLVATLALAQAWYNEPRWRVRKETDGRKKHLFPNIKIHAVGITNMFHKYIHIRLITIIYVFIHT